MKKNAILECTGVSKKFGEMYAVKDFDFEIYKDEILGLIGPNGAGKSTLFNCISGWYKPEEGNIKYKGVDITGKAMYKICHMGVGRTFQIPLPFLTMTGLENVLVSVLYGKSKSLGMKDARREALRHLDFVGLKEKKDMQPHGYTIVDRKRLELARAIATSPELLLLDEVVAGLNPTETLEAMELVKRIRKELGMTVFWVEHVMKAVMGVVDRIVVIHHGVKLSEGSPKTISADKKVIDAYLGERYVF